MYEFMKASKISTTDRSGFDDPSSEHAISTTTEILLQLTRSDECSVSAVRVHARAHRRSTDQRQQSMRASERPFASVRTCTLPSECAFEHLRSCAFSRITLTTAHANTASSYRGSARQVFFNHHLNNFDVLSCLPHSTTTLTPWLPAACGCSHVYQRTCLPKRFSAYQPATTAQPARA
uniref:Uncharacterized protein n=1 Tax=Chrysotila carterae TaxID=13221 RepID=A0A7S4BXT9_CHRCT